MALTEGQLTRRREGLGGSDVAAILGLSPWSTPLDVWMDKTGKVPHRKIESEAMYWGSALEPAIAARYEADHGCVLVEPDPENTPYIHAAREWHMGTPDRLVKGEKIGLEIKTAGWRVAHKWGPNGDGPIPPQYLIQCAWYMALMEYDRWDVAALLGGQDYREYPQERNARLEDMMLTKARDFWELHVLRDIPPEPIRGSDEKAIASLLPADLPKLYIDANGKQAALAREAFEAAAAAKKAEASAKLARAKLAAAMEMAPGIETEHGKARWQKSSSGSQYLKLYPLND